MRSGCDYNGLLVRKAASMARRAGFCTVVDDAATTESSYLVVGLPSRHGGITTLGKLRVSDHRMPGFGRGGWLRLGGAPFFDLRPRGRRYDRQRVVKFLASVGAKP